jgi:hypothetical protein
MPSVEDRLEKLEKSHNRYRGLTTILVFLSVAFVSVGQADFVDRIEPMMPRILDGLNNEDFQGLPEEFSSQKSPKQSFNVIRATEIQIATATGQIVGLFGVDGNRAVLALLDRFGDPILLLGENDAGNGSINVYNKDTKRVSVISVDPNGNGGIDVFNKDEKRVASLGVDPSGRGALEVFNKDIRVAGLGVDPNGNGALNASDKNGNLRAVVGVTPTGDGSLNTFDRNGVAVATQSTSSGIPGDLDRDGDVDFADFLTFAQNFGKR